MSKISEFIEQKQRLYENGKIFDMSDWARTPEMYIASLRNAMALKQLPKSAQNKTAYRRPNPYTVATIIEKEILGQLKSKTRFLETYYDTTPRNKLLYWGALFDTLFNFYANIKSLSVVEPRQQYIKQSEYSKMPKRFRSALKKTEKGYVVEKEPDAKKYRLAFNGSYQKAKFSELMTEARELIKSLYTDSVICHDLIDSDCRETDYGTLERFEYEAIHGTMPSNAGKIKQYFITDKELVAVQKLKSIFREIQDMFLFFEHKSNGQDTIYEYNDAKRRQNIVKEAQAVSRTAQQYVVSVKKATKLLDRQAVFCAERALKETKSEILYGLKKQIDTRIK